MTTVSCLAFHSGRLYACGFVNDQLMVAVSDDDGDSFNKIVSFDQIMQTAECPGANPDAAPSTVCAADLDHWRSELGTLGAAPHQDGGVGVGGPVMDGGGSPGGSGGSDGPNPVRSTFSGCAVSGPNHGPGSAPQLIVVVVTLIWRGLRRTPPGARVLANSMAARRARISNH
jgi:hypothetical protein